MYVCNWSYIHLIQTLIKRLNHSVEFEYENDVRNYRHPIEIIGAKMTFIYIRHSGWKIKSEEGPIHLGGLSCVLIIVTS